MALKRVEADLYVDIDGQIEEIKRQLRQKTGYPYEPMHLVEHLQAAIEGNLVDRQGRLFRNRFAVWKTIKLGTGLKTADDFLNALQEFIDPKWGDSVIFMLKSSAFKVALEETEVDLVKVTVEELGFKKKARVYPHQIYKRARLFGLELCSAEVGPQLRLQYKDQPGGERLYIAMEPIVQSFANRPNPRDFLLSFSVDDLLYGGEPRLQDNFCDCTTTSEETWIFVLPR